MGDLREVTGMRGFAAFYVLLAHVITVFPVTGQPWPGGQPPPVLHFGWIGVDFFFVLSGFLLALPILARTDRVADASFWKGYLARRFLRIAPPYYVSILVALLLAGNLAYLWNEPRDVLFHLAFIHTLDLQTFVTIDPVYWTLGNEFQFYLLLPLLVWALTRRRWPLVFAGLAVTTLAWRALLWNGGWEHAWLSFTLPAFLIHFSLGILTARLYQSPWRPRLASRYYVPAVVALFIVLPLAVLVPDGVYVQGQDTLHANVLLRPLLALGFAASIFGIVTQANPLRSLFSSKPAQVLGNMSYSLYLIHVPILILVAGWRPAANIGLVGFALAGVAASLAGSYVFYLAVERPTMSLRARSSTRVVKGPSPTPTPMPTATPAPS